LLSDKSVGGYGLPTVPNPSVYVCVELVEDPDESDGGLLATLRGTKAQRVSTPFVTLTMIPSWLFPPLVVVP
jgi:hypothetical protein